MYTVKQVEESLFGRIDKSVVNFVLSNKHKELEFDKFYLWTWGYDQYRFGCFERKM
jgi:hypothetical protein